MDELRRVGRGEAVSEPTLAEVRRRIDEVDERILDIIDQRFHLVTLAQAAKKREGIESPIDPGREDVIVQRAMRRASLLNAAEMRGLITAILSTCRRAVYAGPW